jgi:hypothetical protein
LSCLAPRLAIASIFFRASEAMTFIDDGH